MNELRAMQLQLADAMRSAYSSHIALLRGDDLADEASRFAVYRHGYRIRLRDALATEFPGLSLLAGRRFAPLLDEYVVAHPSTHFNIRWHGEGLASFLAATSPWRDHPELAEAARLDWAISVAFDAMDHATVDATELARTPPDAWAAMRLQLLPHARLFPVTCNVDAFRRAADREMARPARRRLAQARHLLVWRPALEVRYRSVAADELPALQGVLDGECFAQLCVREAERHGQKAALPRMASLLARWMGEGLIGRISGF